MTGIDASWLLRSISLLNIKFEFETKSTLVVIGCQYSVKQIRIDYFGHVVQMDQSESRIVTLHSNDAPKTAEAPENEFDG